MVWLGVWLGCPVCDGVGSLDGDGVDDGSCVCVGVGVEVCVLSCPPVVDPVTHAERRAAARRGKTTRIQAR